MASAKQTAKERPDWRKIEHYVDAENWTGRRWAWEFLRRNPAYQAVSEKPNPVRAAKFGIARLKPFQEEYGPEMESDGFWAGESSKVLRPGQVGVSASLKPSEFAVVFDLELFNKMGTGAMHVMLAACKRALERELRRVTVGENLRGPMVRDQFVERGKLGIKGVRHFNLLHLLRLLDATQKKADIEDIIGELYPECKMALQDGPGQQYELAVAKEKVAIDKKKALDLMEKGYLELIPRDYIQDRRKRQKSAVNNT